MSATSGPGEVFVENPPFVWHIYSQTTSGGTWVAYDEPAAIGGEVVTSAFAVDVAAGGRATDLTLAGGDEIVFGAVSYTDNQVSGGGWVLSETNAPGGIAVDSGTTIDSGSVQNVNGGGRAYDDTVNAHGEQDVEGSGAIASGTDLNSGGFQIVWFGGSAAATLLTSSGLEQVLSGGRDFAAVVSNGGTQEVQTDGLAVSTTIAAGGEQTVGGLVFSDSTALRAVTAAVTIEAGGLRLEHRERLDVGLLLRGVGAPRCERDGHLVARVAMPKPIPPGVMSAFII